MNVRTSLFAALCAFALSPAANAWNRNPAVEFADLPDDPVAKCRLRNPEGITVDRKTGEFYVADFDYRGTCGTGRIAVFSKSGKLLRILRLNSSPALLGLDFRPTPPSLEHELLVIDFGAHQVLSTNPQTGASTVFATGFDAAAGLNALTFDKDGNVYISDSFQGIIWKVVPVGPRPYLATPWVQNQLLMVYGPTPGIAPLTNVPPFGANGLAFNRAGVLFVANTANDTVIQIPSAHGVAGAPAVFTNSINGADGLIIDGDDNLWVAANQADEIVVVDPSGKAIAKLGDFDGIAPDGSPRGLLFPASPVFYGEFVYVTNLALDLRDFNPQFQSVDSEWAAQVTRWNVARISRHLPPTQGGLGR
jgi:DNA-binding beta-propeller fold protein YncE